MKYADVAWLIEAGKDIHEEWHLSDFNDFLSVNGRVALPLSDISNTYGSQVEIEVLDTNGSLIGVLCLCKNMDIDLPQLTVSQLVCYLHEIEAEYYEQPYSFRKNYLVLETSFFDDYIRDYRKTSFLWGGFVHEEDKVQDAYIQTPTSLTVVPGIKLMTPYHLESGVRGIAQPFAFERFLKFYHLVELLFDYDTVTKIKGLGDDLRGVGQILSNYDRNEVERLKQVIKGRCDGFDNIADKLNFAFVSTAFYDKSKVIFFDFGKEGNPLRDEKEQRFDELVRRGGFTEDNAKQVKLAPDRAQYEKLVLDVAVYWLYRIRCSIAHSRIGEYVMTMDDEEYVVKFAEPLIREILVQAFSK